MCWEMRGTSEGVELRRHSEDRRQDRKGQDKTGQDTRQHTRQMMTRRDKTRQDKTRPYFSNALERPWAIAVWWKGRGYKKRKEGSA